MGFMLTLNAQTIPEKYDTPEKRSEIATQQMIEFLPLKPHEVPAIRKINLKYAKMVEKEIIDPELNWLSSLFKMKEINKQREAELFPLFDEKQKANYQKLKARSREQLLELIGF